MTVAKSSKNLKPQKPYPDFPLNAHNNGQWAKRIKGKLYCFGKWDDWKAALEKYKSEIDGIQLYGVRTNSVAEIDQPDHITLKRSIDRFLTVQEEELADGEISPEHYSDLLRTLQTVVPKIIPVQTRIRDLTPDHFRRLKRRFGSKLDGTPASPATMMGHIRRVKILFSWLLGEGLIDHLPAYGKKFGKLSKRQQQESANSADSKQFTREEIHKLLNACTSRTYRIKAMVLLGVNCAMGPRDIAELTFDQLDLENGWLIGSRNKTGVRRFAKLWPETVAALQTVIEKRFEPANADHTDLVFITRMKRPFLNQGAISRIFAKLKLKAKINGKNKGFYSLRHTCRDIANQQADDTASRWIMGHKRRTIDDKYTRNAPRARIEAVTNHVHTWLFGEGGR